MPFEYAFSRLWLNTEQTDSQAIGIRLFQLGRSTFRSVYPCNEKKSLFALKKSGKCIARPDTDKTAA